MWKVVIMQIVVVKHPKKLCGVEREGAWQAMDHRISGAWPPPGPWVREKGGDRPAEPLAAVPLEMGECIRPMCCSTALGEGVLEDLAVCGAGVDSNRFTY